ncbi:gamma carbonic anhydrase family protein [Sulfurospirillum arcachonense]|uniref:gamma carbonic anhydrase family protein n=1 Tax=Sulfurospirillum arcachonense TaxID=57666 RepID=UPI00046A22A6|nr:gamma carbonic anhydrase family protein [Sulfurospirillum arcachonense]
MIMKFEENYPVINKSVFTAQSADIIGDVSIDEDSSIWFGCVVRADIHHIKIGKRSNIQDLSMLHVTHFTKEDKSDGNPTIIGDDVTIGHRVMLHGCEIKNACLIGMSATILDGAVIGEESIVGANSLVTKDKEFPPRSLIMGSPAKVIRQLNQDEISFLYQSAKNYVEYKNRYLKNML